MPRGLIDQAGEDLMIGIDEINGQIQIIEDMNGVS